MASKILPSLFALLLPLAGLWGADPPPLPDFPIRVAPAPSLFDSFAALPEPDLGFLQAADQPAAPDLVGEAALARARHYEDLRLLVPDPRSTGRAGLAARPFTFGGYDRGTIFAGGSFLFSGVSQWGDSLGSFFAGGFGAEYSRGADALGLESAGTASLGLFGLAPLPWALGARGSVDGAFNMGGQAGLDLGGPLLDLGAFGGLSLFGGAGLRKESTGPLFAPADWYVHSLAELGRYEHVGAFAKGYGLWAALNVEAPLGSGEALRELRSGADGAYQFGRLVGVELRASLSAASEPREDWSTRFRGLDPSVKISGDESLMASLDLPLLFARGRLFRSDDLAVEFTLNPWCDAGYVRGAGSGLLAAANLHVTIGAGLAMSLDRHSRDSLVVSAGQAVSEPLGGASDPRATAVSASLFLEL